MKKILSIFLCLIFALSIVSCDTKEHPSESETLETTLQENIANEHLPYTFISKQERLSWKDNIITVLSGNNSYEHTAAYLIARTSSRTVPAYAPAKI